jgi:enamine deaminase RidA (YjgF/YER057c/UK114 family)
MIHEQMLPTMLADPGGYADSVDGLRWANSQGGNNMGNRVTILPKGMETIYEKIGYAPAVAVGRTIYVSGQIGRDADMRIVEGSEAQITQAFENVRKVLEAAGGTMADIVDLTTFHTDMLELALFMQVKDRYITKEFPAWTAVGVAALGGVPGLIVEIKAVAVLGAGSS